MVPLTSVPVVARSIDSNAITLSSTMWYSAFVSSSKSPVIPAKHFMSTDFDDESCLALVAGVVDLFVNVNG